MKLTLIKRSSRLIQHPRSGSFFILCSALVLAAAAVACGTEQAEFAGPIKQTASPPPKTLQELVELSVPTYDGSGQSVHPDVVEFPDGFQGRRYWLALTPYPNSNDRYENPSILVSDDGLALSQPQSIPNPVVSAPTGKGYNSDPELLFDASTNGLDLFYRVVKDGSNSIRVIRSGDGVTWTGDRLAFKTRNHHAVSPTISMPSPIAPAMAWVVDAGRKGCSAHTTRVSVRLATDVSAGVADAAWSRPQWTDLAQPGYNIWHIKIRYVPERREYWSLYSAFPADGVSDCRSGDLFFARSEDGIHWSTFPRPLLRHGGLSWTSAAIYRSTFLYDASSDELRVWLSSLSTDNTWHLGFARFNMTATLGQLTRPDSVVREPSSANLPIRADDDAP